MCKKNYVYALIVCISMSISLSHAMQGQQSKSQLLGQFISYVTSSEPASIDPAIVQEYLDIGLDIGVNTRFSHVSVGGSSSSGQDMPLYKWLVHHSGHPDDLIGQYEMAASEKLMQHIKQATCADQACRYMDECTVDVCDPQGRTPLYYALASIVDPSVCKSVVTQLIIHGASPHICIYNEDNTCKASTLMIAALLWRHDIIKHMMEISQVSMSYNEPMRTREIDACKAPLTTVTDGSGDYARAIRARGDQSKTQQLIDELIETEKKARILAVRRDTQ